MIEEYLSIFGNLLILLGSFFILTGSFGIIRMPDFYTRLHPAGVTDSFGAPLALIGIIFTYGFDFISGKVILLIIFLMITGPTATHIISKAAIFKGVKPVGKEL